MPPLTDPQHPCTFILAPLHCSYDFLMRRDFLGSILGTGIERSKVGDIILLGETGAQILVAAEIVEHFEQSLTQVPLL